ncbi:MAG TPA: hypothetical protein VGU03_11105 [Frateuria sp.]|uniref:hypothetical protein n=1 Tax=Frateuria sp. TaxID=2211372 RepID=UPI002DF46B07|nr:hypothetical protein [Frateuria sp.]
MTHPHTDTAIPQETASAAAIAAETMTGDLMAALIDEMKTMPRPWPAMSEQDQQDVIYRAQERVQSAIAQAVNIIASDNRPTIVATVESVTVKEGIKAVLTLPKSDQQRHDLFDAAGQAVLLVVAGRAPYSGGADQVQADPDQPSLNGFGESAQDERELA